MVPQIEWIQPISSGFRYLRTQSVTFFSDSIAKMRDGKVVQMPHSCYHVETIRHPKSS